MSRSWTQWIETRNARRREDRFRNRRREHFLSRFRSVQMEFLEDRRLLATDILSLNDLTLGATDTTLFEIGGPEAGNPAGGTDDDGYDRIEVAQDAALSGTLRVELVNNYVPDVGTEFEILAVGGSRLGTFTDAEGLFAFPDGDRYFQVVETANGMKLVVAAAPGGLTYAPQPDDQDGFGEFLNGDYFGITQFTYAGTLSTAGFVDIQGTFTLDDRGATIAIGSPDADIFLGADFGGDGALGLQVTGANTALIVEDAGYALASSGIASFVGLDGLQSEATFDVGANSTGHAVNTTITTSAGPVSISLPAVDPNTNEAPQFFVGNGPIKVPGAFSIDGDFAAAKDDTGAIQLDVENMSLVLSAGRLDVFQFSGSASFSIDGENGFQLADSSIDDAFVLGSSTGGLEIPIGPLVVTGSSFELNELQFAPLEDPSEGSSIVASVAIGIDQARFQFGSVSPKVTTGLLNLEGEFAIDSVVSPTGLFSGQVGLFTFVAAEIQVRVNEILEVDASDVEILYDPVTDKNNDGIVSDAEQAAYNSREIVRIDSAEVVIPKIELHGTLEPFDRDGGTDPVTGLPIPGETIPGLSVRNNGFRLGEAKLSYAETLEFGEIMEITGIAAGVQDFGVTFGEKVDFDGNVFIAADEAKLFPDKTFEITIEDSARDGDGEAVRATLKFTDGVPSGFEFLADQAEFKFGEVLEVHTDTFVIDTTATGEKPVVSFGALGATISAGPLKLGGEIRSFGFLSDGSIRTFAGFGVRFSAESADGKSFQWPEWLPIQITEVGIQWPDINTRPEDFRLVVSAAVEGIKGLPKLDISGAVTGIQIDVGLLLRGQFPITGIESLGVTVSGDMFGGKITAGMIGGIIALDENGEEVPPSDLTTPIVDRVFFLGLEGGFKVVDVGGFTIRLALTEKGPLGVQVTGDLPEGILLEPISGLKLSGFSGGVEFFTSLPDAYKPEDLLAPDFAPALSNLEPLEADEWLEEVRNQVIEQYNALKESPVAGGFLAAFTNPMVISGGGQLAFHTPESVLKINAEVRIDTSGKILLTGDMILLSGLQRVPARIFADLSKIAKGNAKILLMAQDIPTGMAPLVPLIPTTLEIRGGISMKYFGPDGEEVDFFDDTPSTDSPTALVIDPAQDGRISQGKWETNRYVDIRFRASPGAQLKASTITDTEPELELILPDGTAVPIDGAAVHPDGQPDGVYRYALPVDLEIEPGAYEIHMLPNTWEDNADQANPSESLAFEVVGASISLAGPESGDRIDRADIHRAGRLAVRFTPTAGSRLDLTSILDAAPEVVLTGAAAAGVALGAPVRDANDDDLFYYPFTGSFGVGVVGVQLVANAFLDTQGNGNSERNNEFTITGPEIRLRDPADGTVISLTALNERGYLEVYISPSNEVDIDESSLTDDEPEFTLSGAGDGIVVSGAAIPVPGEPNVYRYVFQGSFTQVGEVVVEFLEGSFQDVSGVGSAPKTESFLLQGVSATMIDPLALDTAGLTLINDRGYLDVRFTPTGDATLDEATILDAAPEFTLVGDAASAVKVSGAPTALGDGVYRYTFTGEFETGAIDVVWLADAASDSDGVPMTAGAETFYLDAPSADLFSPTDRMRVDRSKLNDAGYIDIQFNDATGRGLDVASITDAEQEFQFLVLDEAGEEWVLEPHVGINGAALQLNDATFRYFFSNTFQPGVVRVQFLEGTFTDADGAANLAEEEQFVVVSTAPSFQFQIDGTVMWRLGFTSGVFGDLSDPDHLREMLKMFEPIVGEIGGENEEGYSALRDFLDTVDTGLSIIDTLLESPLLRVDGFLRFGSELLVNAGGDTMGARTTVDFSGAVSVFLAGPMGAAAGRIVVQADNENGFSLWGVAELQVNLAFLNKVGIELQGFANLQFNTTGVQQTESLTFIGMGDGGTDLTQTYLIDPYSLQVAAAGKLIFHIPTFDEANPFGAELFRLSAAASIAISAEGLSMFVKGDLEVGPSDIRLLDIDVLGVLAINDEGFAGDMWVKVQVGDIAAIRDYFQFDVSARVVFNVTGKDQEVPILDRFLDYLTDDFKARLQTCSDAPTDGESETFANGASKCYVVGAAPPPRPTGEQGPEGPYVVIDAQGNLMIAQAFRLHGDYYFELNAAPEMFLTVNGSLALDPIAAVAASGTLHIDRYGAYGGLQLGGSLDVGVLKIFGAAQFEFNTQDFEASIQRYKFDFDRQRVSDERETVVLEPRSFRIVVAGYLNISDSFKLQGSFSLENNDQVIAVHVDAKFEAFGVSLLYVNGDAAIVKQGDVGFVCNLVAMMHSPIELDGIFELGADFQLLLNTRGGSGIDQYDFGVERGSLLVSFVGDMKLLSLIDLHGSGYISYARGLFRMEVNMGFEILGAGVDASGFFSSEGEFDLFVAGHLLVGFPGFGLRGDASFHISRLDSNGKDPYGDLNFAFNVVGNIGARLDLFGITIAGVNLTFGYLQSTGKVFLRPCVQIIAWEACTEFTIMYIKPPPKVFLAGNVDDVEGTAFHGGELHLNMGPRAYLRNEQIDNIHEGYQVESLGPDTENGGEIVRVRAFGRSQSFRGVTKVIADGGAGHDYIEIGPGLLAPVEVRGGDRRDFVRIFSEGPARIEGGAGDDELQAGYGDDVFVFGDDFGQDNLADLGGVRDYDFARVTEDTKATVAGDRLLLSPSGYNRRIIGFGNIDGVRVPMLPMSGSRVLVLMPNHGFQAGDKVAIDAPDLPEYSRSFTVSDVSQNSFLFLDNNFLNVPPRGVPVLVDLDTGPDTAYVEALIFHDGEDTAYLNLDVPDALPVDRLTMEGSARAYTGNFQLTRVATGWFSFPVDYDDVREELDTHLIPAQMEFGSGDDTITFAGNQAVTMQLTDAAGGLDTLQIKDDVVPTFVFEAGRAVNGPVNLTYSGFDQFNLLDPTAEVTLATPTPGEAIDLNAIGIGVVAKRVTLPVDLTAASLELNARDSIALDHELHVGSLDVRVFGDAQGISVGGPLNAPESIQLAAPDGTVALPAGTQLAAETAVIKAKSLTTPNNRLDLSVDTLTIVTAVGAGSELHITNDRDLLLTKTTDAEHLATMDATAATVFANVTWPTTASSDWTAQVFDGATNPYSLVADGVISIELPPLNPNDSDEDTLVVDGGVRSYGGSITLTADEIDFLGGAASVKAPGDLTMQAATDAWTYRLGTSAESGGGAPVDPAQAPRTFDLPTRDLAALADGFASITIGRSEAGNSMYVGDAFAMNVIKATGEPRVVDATLKDATTLRSDMFVVQGDARAPSDRLTLVGGSAEIRKVNLHTPNNANPDSGLTARELVLDLQDSLQVGGWLLGEQLVDINLAATVGDFSLISDAASAIRQTGSVGSLSIVGTKGLRVAGAVTTAAENATPTLRGGTRFDLLAGADVAVLGANSTLLLTASQFVSLASGSTVRAGVAVDFSTGSPRYDVIGANGQIDIVSPHELLLGGLVASSGGLTITAGTPVSTHADTFAALTSAKPDHYLAQQERYAILLTGTLVALGDNESLVLSSNDDVIVFGNISLPGVNSTLQLQSDTFVFVEGQIVVSGDIDVYGGVEADGSTPSGLGGDGVSVGGGSNGSNGAGGSTLGGADSRGTSVYFGATGRLNNTQAGAKVFVQGGQDVDVHLPLVAGGSIGATGVTWAGDGSAVELVAGQQLLLDAPVQAAGDVTLRPGTAGADDGGRNLLFTTVSGLNAAGLGVNGAGSVITVTAPGDLELAGNITAGATIRQTFGPQGQLLSETYEWSGRESRIEVVAGGRVLVGADTTNLAGAPVQKGTFLRASDRIEITGGANSSGFGIVVYPASGLSTENANGAIVLNSPLDADIQGTVVSGGAIELVQDATGQSVGYRVTRYDGTSSVRIEAEHQVRIGREIYAGQRIDLVGGDDPVDASDALSGRGVLLLGSAFVHTQHTNGQINLIAPGDIDVLAPVNAQELEPAGWPETADGRLSADVVIDVSVDRGFTYGAAVTIHAADTANNHSLADLASDVQAAVDAAAFVVQSSRDPRHPVGASYRPSTNPPELRVTLRDGKLAWTTPFSVSIAGTSTNANLLGLNIGAGQHQTSETRYTIAAVGAGSVVNVGPATPTVGGDSRLYLGGRLLAHTGVNLFGGWQSGDLQLSAQGLDLDYSGAIETLAGSIHFVGGDTFELKGDLIARGTGSDVTVDATTALVLSGHVIADDVVALRVDGDGGTLTINPTGRADAAGQIVLHAPHAVVIDGMVGGQIAPASLDVAADAGDVQVLAGSGRLQSAGTLSVQGERLDFAGVLLTNGATADSNDFEVTLDASSSLRLSGAFDTIGSVRVTSPVIEMYDFTASQAGAGSDWSFVTDGSLSFGKVTADSQGRNVSHAVQIQAVDQLLAPSPISIFVAPGSQLSVSGHDGQLRLTAPTIDVVGALYAGAAFASNGSPDWQGGSADILLDAGQITIGGLGPDANGTLVTRGGLLAATGQIVITADDAGDDSAFKLEGPSRILTTPAGSEGLATLNAPASVDITSAGLLKIYGVIDAQGPGANACLTAPGEILIDGLVRAAEELDVTAGDRDARSAYLTQLILKSDAQGRLLDSQNRLIDQQGYLIDAQGQYVDANGQPLAPGADPVIGGAPVRMSGGGLDAAHVVITGPKKLELLGSVGTLTVVGNRLVSGTQTLEVMGGADVVMGGRLQVEQSIDVRGRQLTVTASGALLGGTRVHLFGTDVDHAGYIGSAQLVVMNSTTDVDVTGAVQSGGDVRINAGVGANWTSQQLLSATVAAADLSDGDVLIDGSGVLDASGTVRVAAGGNFQLTADAVVTPNLASVTTPVIVQRERTVDRVVGTREVQDGVYLDEEVRFVPTTVTEQVGTTAVRIGRAYHTLDVTLTQDAYYNGSTIREYFVQNVDYQNEDIPWTSYSRQPDGSVLLTPDTPAFVNPVPAPADGATFAELTDDQRRVVLQRLGYMPLYNFGYTNGQTYQTVNGNTTILAWTPEWASDDLFIHHFDYPGIEDKYIRLPEGAIPEFLRVVSQGSRTLPAEVVGRYRDRADVQYAQDRSAFVNTDLRYDFDNQDIRWYVTAVPASNPAVVDGETQSVRNGTRQYEVYDGHTINGAGGADLSLVHVFEPIWYESELPNGALDSSPNIGYDVLGKRTMSQTGYLADSASLVNGTHVGTLPNQFVGTERSPNKSVLQSVRTVYDKGGWFIPPNSFDWTPSGSAAESAASRAFVSWGDDVRAALNYQMPNVDLGLNVNQDLINQGYDLARDVDHYAFNSIYSGTYVRGSGSYRIDAMAYYGYDVYFKKYEDYLTYQYYWTGKWHDVADGRQEFSFQWTTQEEDVYGTIPVFATYSVIAPVSLPVEKTRWRTEDIVQQETVVVTERIEQTVDGLPTAAFANESLRAGQEVHIDAGQDVSFVGLTRATGPTSEIVVRAARDVTLDGATPDGAAAGSQAAIADLRAGLRVDVSGGRNVDMLPNAVIKADDGDASTQNGEIRLTAGETLTVQSDAFGGYEVHLHAGGDVLLQASLDSGHLVDVQAGLGAAGIGSIITDVNTDIATFGSEIHLKAGPNGGDLQLTDAQIYTAGPIELSAPKGSLVHTGGRIIADSLVALVRDGAAALLDVRNVSVTITGAGDLELLTEGDVTLVNVSVANGSINVQGFGDVVAEDVRTLGGMGDIRLGSYAGNLLLGKILATGAFTAEANVGQINGLPGGSIDATDVQLQGQMSDTLNVASDDITLISQFPGDVVINHLSSDTLTLRQVYVLDGSLIVQTKGDLVVLDVQLLSNTGEHRVDLQAVGNVVIDNVIAGDYAATEAEAAALRAARGLSADAAIRTLNDVSIVSSKGAISAIAGDGPDVDVVANRLTLRAAFDVSGIELAVNQMTEVSSAKGSITLSDLEGVGDPNEGLHVVVAAAPRGALSLTAEENILASDLSAGGATGGLRLVSQTGSLAIQPSGEFGARMSSGAGLELRGNNVSLEGTVKVAGDIAVLASGDFRTTSASTAVTANSLSIDAQTLVTLDGVIAARDRVAVVSNAGDIVMAADIMAKPGGALGQISLDASRDLNLVNGSLGPVATRLTLYAGRELATDVAPVSWIVTGANGELAVSSGSDLTLAWNSRARADGRVSLVSTGFVNDDGQTEGGVLTLADWPRGYSTAVPSVVSLMAADYVHVHQNVSAGQTLTLGAPHITFSRNAVVRDLDGDIQTDGGAAPGILEAMFESFATVQAPNVTLAGGSTLHLEQDGARGDSLRSPGLVTLIGGVVTLDVASSSSAADEVADAAATMLVGTVTGSGGLTKRGDGDIELAANYTYSGPTNIEDGTVVLTGSLASASAVSVTRATLAGAGTVGGSLTLGDGSVLLVGTRPGQVATLHTGALTFLPGSQIFLELGPTDRDQLVVTGPITIGKGTHATVTCTDGFVLAPDARPVLVWNDTNADPVVGGFARVTLQSATGEILTGGLMYLGGDGNDIAAIAFTTELKLDDQGNLLVTDISTHGQDDLLTIQADDAKQQFVISDPEASVGIVGFIRDAVNEGIHTVRVPFGSVLGQILFNTLAGDDTLTVDYSLGAFPSGVQFDGGEQDAGDLLRLVGGSPLETVSHELAGVDAGSVEASGSQILAYGGVEGLVDLSPANVRALHFQDGDETITVVDRVMADNQVEVGSPYTLPVVLLGPLVALAIYAGGGDDVVTIQSLDSRITGSLDIDGEGGSDRMNFEMLSGPVHAALEAEGAIDGLAGRFRLPTHVGKLANIDLLTGSGATGSTTVNGDELAMDWDVETSWSLEGADSGRVEVREPGRALAFDGFENLAGAPNTADKFVIEISGRLSGQINGRGPSRTLPGDTLDYSSWSTPITVDLTLGSATAVAGGLAGDSVGSSIENVSGGSADDDLRGDVDENVFRGGAGVDTVRTGDGSDVIEVAGSDAINDVMQGGPGGWRDLNDYDVIRNIADLPVTLSGFNVTFAEFANSIDEYDGNGQLLQGTDAVNSLHLGLTKLTNTPSVLGLAGDDAVTIAYRNDNPTPITYDGGEGTADSVVLTFTPQQFASFQLSDLQKLNAYLTQAAKNPEAVLDLSSNGNVIVKGFESAVIGFTDDDTVTLLGGCFTMVTNPSQIRAGTDGPDSLTGTVAADLIFGTGGDDFIDGLRGADCIFGGAGRDNLTGGDDSDTIRGGSDNDVLSGNAGYDDIMGGLGDDVLDGGDNNDQLLGDAGNDTLRGGYGSDTMEGGIGDDLLYGEGDMDWMYGRDGDDRLFGGDGPDLLEGGKGIDELFGESGDDNFTVQSDEAEFDLLRGGAGNDRITNLDRTTSPRDIVFNRFLGYENQIELFYVYNSRVIGNAGANVLDFRLENTAAPTAFVSLYDVASIRGLDGDDVIHGAASVDSIQGDAGNDILYGYGGNDNIQGGDGDDTAYGGSGGDWVVGGNGKDVLWGGLDHDTLNGEDGDDYLYGEAGNDTLDGGLGGDHFDGGLDDDSILTEGLEGTHDDYQGGMGVDRLVNSSADPSLPMTITTFDGTVNSVELIFANSAEIVGDETALPGEALLDFRREKSAAPTLFVTIHNLLAIRGAAVDYIIYGTNSRDVIFGEGGNDVVYGLGGNDEIYGGAGDDVVYGGAGGDSIVGEDGADFLFGETDNDTLDGGSGNDSLDGGDGADILIGGTGADTIAAGLGNDDIRVRGDDAAGDSLQGGGGTGDRITNSGGDLPFVLSSFLGQSNGIEYVYANNAEIWGTDGANTLDFRMTASTFVALYNVAAIRGLGGNDLIHGSNAADVIDGGAGDDVLYGYGGNDTIEGGLGVDTLYGGSGTDSFRFTWDATDATQQDSVGDWSSDYIRLTGYGTSYAAIQFNTPSANLMSLNPSKADYNKKIRLAGVTTKPSTTYIQIVN